MLRDEGNQLRQDETREAPNVSAFISGLSALVEKDPDKPLLNESEKLTIHAKNVADEHISVLLDTYNQDYEEVLRVLRDVERTVKVNDEVPGNYEILQMVRCMRGKWSTTLI